MSVKQFIPAIKYGNAVTSDEVDLSGATGDVTFTAGNPTTSTQSVTALNPAIGQTKTVALTSAQILALASTPVTLVTTTATGTMVIVDSMVFEFNATTTTYTAGGALGVFYNAQTTTGNIMSADVPITFLTSSSLGGAYFLASQSSTSAGLTPVPNVGVALGIKGTTNYATGTGTGKVFVNYYIVTI